MSDYTSEPKILMLNDVPEVYGLSSYQMMSCGSCEPAEESGSEPEPDYTFFTGVRLS